MDPITASILVGATVVTQLRGSYLGRQAAKEKARINANYFAEQKRLEDVAEARAEFLTRSRGDRFIAEQKNSFAERGVALSGSIFDFLAQEQAAINRDVAVEQMQSRINKANIQMRINDENRSIRDINRSAKYQDGATLLNGATNLFTMVSSGSKAQVGDE